MSKEEAAFLEGRLFSSQSELIKSLLNSSDFPTNQNLLKVY